MSEMPEKIWAFSDPEKGWYEDDLCVMGGLEYHRDDIHQAVVKERDALKAALRECLRCILMKDNGITDVIWQSNFVTLAEYIADALDEDIDFEDVAASVQDRKIEYKCPKTSDFEVLELRKEIEELKKLNEWHPIRTLDFENLDEMFILVTGLCADGESQYVVEAWVDDGVMYDFNMREIKLSELTHWKLKPKPPEVSDD